MVKKDAALKPDDFPVQVEKNKILTTTGKHVASAKDERTASEVARRLNADAHRRAEDRWSA